MNSPAMARTMSTLLEGKGQESPKSVRTGRLEGETRRGRGETGEERKRRGRKGRGEEDGKRRGEEEGERRRRGREERRRGREEGLRDEHALNPKP